MIAAVVAMSIVAVAAIGLATAALVIVVKAKDGQRVAEVAGARMEEALIAARDAVDVSESLHKAERERADVLEEELHDADVLLSTGGGTPAAGPSRSRLLSALKRVANHAAGAGRARSAGDPKSEPVPQPAAARSTRTRGEPPTEPGRDR